jgi:hypothetical protein
MQVTKTLALWCVLGMLSASCWAQVQQARGKASVTYAGKTASPEDKAKAHMVAQLKAVEFYYAEAGQSEAETFDAIRDRILADPDRYILEATTLAEEDKPELRQYTVAVRVSLNVANLRNAVKANSAVVKGGAAGRSQMAFMFVSRQVDSTRSFDDRVYKRVDTKADAKGAASSTQKGSEGEQITKGQISTNASSSKSETASVHASVAVETGGSVTRKASESTYRLIPSANLSQVFTSNFARAGFKVSEASMVEPYTNGQFKVAMVEGDYATGMDLKPATLAALVRGMRAAQIPYVSLGTLDVGMADKDPNTGLVRVAVTVNAKLLDLGQTIPDTVASVGPVQYAGVGPTEDEARGNALKKAAESAARELTSQITNVGMR